MMMVMKLESLQQISVKSSKQISRLLSSWSVLVLARGQKAQLPTQVPAARLDYNYHEHYKANTNCQLVLKSRSHTHKRNSLHDTVLSLEF